MREQSTVAKLRPPFYKLPLRIPAINSSHGLLRVPQPCVVAFSALVPIAAGGSTKLGTRYWTSKNTSEPKNGLNPGVVVYVLYSAPQRCFTSHNFEM